MNYGEQVVETQNSVSTCDARMVHLPYSVSIFLMVKCYSSRKLFCKLGSWHQVLWGELLHAVFVCIVVVYYLVARLCLILQPHGL